MKRFVYRSLIAPCFFNFNFKKKTVHSFQNRPITSVTPLALPPPAPPPPPPPPPPNFTFPPRPRTDSVSNPSAQDTLFASARASLKQTALPVEAPINFGGLGAGGRAKRQGQPTVNIAGEKMAAFLTEMKNVRLRKVSSGGVAVLGLGLGLGLLLPHLLPSMRMWMVLWQEAGVLGVEKPMAGTRRVRV